MNNLEDEIQKNQEILKERFREMLFFAEKNSEYEDERPDENIEKLFHNDPPDWMTASKIYSPLITLLDRFVKDKAYHVEKKQEELKILIERKNRKSSK